MTREEHAHAAAEKLRQAVLGLKVGAQPRNRQLTPDFWPAVGKASIMNWVDDAERASTRIARALEFVEVQGDTEEARDALEGALWRISAGREKLEAVFVLCFGLPSLEPYKKTSVRFEPNAEKIRVKLRELATSHPAARELADLGKQLAEHPGVTLRHQLSHQFAVITDAAELCWIDIAHVRGDSIHGWTGGPLYAENTIDQGPITREANWGRAVSNVEECFMLLVRSFELMAEIVGAAAVLEPPQPVYKNDDTNEVSTSDPRRGAR